MRYLPDLSYRWGSDSFWSTFVENLKYIVSRQNLLVPYAASHGLRSMQELKVLPPHALDQHNRPIFDDLDGSEAIYLSQNYDPEDLHILCSYGLGTQTMTQVIARARADLSRTTSKLRTETCPDWHSRAAKLLRLPFETSSLAAHVPEVRALRLLPLMTGKWVSINDGPIFFPETDDGFLIPDGLNMRIVHKGSIQCGDRRKRFAAVGVTAEETIRTRWRVLEACAALPQIL